MDEAPKPPPLFGKRPSSLSFGQYMASKIRKLRGQNEGIERISRMFEGVVIYVNGHTEPSKEELRQLILKHGGQFEAYQTSRVTHMIATHVAESKLREIMKARKPLPIVNPKWILDSIAKGRQCKTQPYLYSGVFERGQQTLNIPASTSNQFTPQVTSSATSGQQGIASVHNTYQKQQISSALKPQIEPSTSVIQPPFQVKPSSVVHEKNVLIHTPAANIQINANPTIPDPKSIKPALPPRPSNKPQPTAIDLKKKPLSTRDGAAVFVRSFFQNSRLHHIGSWKSFFQSHALELMADAPVYNSALYGSSQSTDRVILHVDMDCFFVSVAIRNLPPVYKDLPIAVAHSGFSSHADSSGQNKKGTSEISSCNYVARNKGLRAGMFMERAKGLCPDLIVLPYDFEAIERISCDIYKIFFKFTPVVQAVSCDEAFLEFPRGTNGAEMARTIRAAILEKTQCPASVGIAHNILLARLATKRAKPDNVFTIDTSNAAEHVDSLPVSQLPGVGHVTQKKLSELDIQTCQDLQQWTVDSLTPHVGPKTAVTLHRFANGIDYRPIERFQVVKSVSAEISYGVRLDTEADTVDFITELAKEVHARLERGGFQTSSLTMKLKVRQEGAPIEPSKFLGHGAVDASSKTLRLSNSTANVDEIIAASLSLWKQFKMASPDIRGIGLQASKLTKNNQQGKPSADINRWFNQPPISPPRTSEAAARAKVAHTALTLSQIDQDVLQTLPQDIQNEILQDISKKPPKSPKWPSSYSQIDKNVLDALPKSIQREIQHSFCKPAQLKPPQVKKKSSLLVAQKFIPPSPPSESQIDENVWNALPSSIQQEFPYQPRKKELPRTNLDQLSLESGEALILDKITERRLDQVQLLLRRLKRNSIDNQRGFDELLSRCNQRLCEKYGAPLAPECIAPFHSS